MEIQLISPQNNIIKKYIHYYYTASIHSDKYNAFPNHYFPTCLVKNGIFHYSNGKITVQKNAAQKFIFNGVNVYQKPITIQFEGNFTTFNIIFHPYGLAQFADKPLALNNNICLDYTYVLQPFLDQHEHFFSYDDEEKIKHLEKYLLSIYKVKNHTTEVIKSINNMLQESYKDKVDLNISDKTLYRAFKNICGTPPTTILKVIRLRKAFANMKGKTKKEKLTEIAHALDYFDQAHFTNSFKRLTKKQPKNFFADITHLSETDIFFEFLKNV